MTLWVGPDGPTPLACPDSAPTEVYRLFDDLVAPPQHVKRAHAKRRTAILSVCMRVLQPPYRLNHRKNLAFAQDPPSSRVVRRAFLATLVLAALGGCMANRTSTDKLLDAAHEHNGAVRFGRMDIALDHVAASAKNDWLQRRSAWKNNVRIIDVELEGMQLVSNTEANVQIRLAWQHLDEAELRSTEVVQKWQAKNGPWQLVTEDCTSGDTTLLVTPDKPKEK